MENKYYVKDTPREIPVKEDPNKSYPDKAPGRSPDTEPGKQNPRNPNEDKVQKFI